MRPSDTDTPGEAAAATLSPPRRPDDPGAPFEVEVRLSARWRWAVIVVFAALVTLPGALREFSGDSVRGAMAAVFHPGSEPVADRLRAVEKRVDDGAWTRPIRAWMQTVLWRGFGEGNRKVLVGRDGWFFHRPGVQALTGRGPVLGPTHSVAKDPSLKEWDGPIAVIREFADQLQERGIRLLLVPVPDKAALWSAHLASADDTGAPARRRHPDWRAFVEALRGKVEVVDLSASLPYLRDDTHWEAAGARAAAAGVATAIRGTAIAPPEPATHANLTGQGDLVASLGLTGAAAAELRTTLHVPVAAPAESSADAPVVLLGDSNVNMYDDSGLPYHQRGAGFASWLSACLGEPLHVLAINGGGATQVRQRFASLPDDVVRAKKTVVWVLAERDLFMDPAVARGNGVEWRRVRFNPAASAPATAPPEGALVIEATLRSKSELIDMNAVVYPDALYTAEFTVDRVVRGTYEPKDLSVVLWNFRERVVQPTARLTPGQRLRLALVPFLEKAELTKMPLADELQRFDLELLFAEKAEVLEP